MIKKVNSSLFEKIRRKSSNVREKYFNPKHIKAGWDITVGRLPPLEDLKDAIELLNKNDNLTQKEKMEQLKEFKNIYKRGYDARKKERVKKLSSPFRTIKRKLTPSFQAVKKKLTPKNRKTFNYTGNNYSVGDTYTGNMVELNDDNDWSYGGSRKTRRRTRKTRRRTRKTRRRTRKSRRRTRKSRRRTQKSRKTRRRTQKSRRRTQKSRKSRRKSRKSRRRTRKSRRRTRK